MTTTCFHCADPACTAACPTNAIMKRAEDGIVVVDWELCLGKDDCSLCKSACPYGMLFPKQARITHHLGDTSGDTKGGELEKNIKAIVPTEKQKFVYLYQTS